MKTDRSNWGVRWRESLHRIEIVYIIIEAFGYYQEVNIYKNVMKCSQDYDSCEKAANMINMIFNQDVKPTELMNTEDELSNKLLDSYKGLTDSLKCLPSANYPYEKEDIMAVLAYLYHHNSLLRMKCYDYYVFMGKIFRVFRSKRQYYCLGIKWLIGESYEYCFWNGRTRHVDTMGFRHTFREIEKAFNEIIEKRKKRKEKK